MSYSEEEKAMWVEDWKDSGKSALAYARANGLCHQTFARWTKAERVNSIGFVEVSAPIPSAARDGGEMVVEKGGVKIHIPLGCGAACLRTIVGVLGGLQ